MTWFEKIIPSRIKTERRTRSVPEGLWIKCPSCDAVLYRAELERNLQVCPKCNHHMRIGARDRLARFLDPDSGVERDGVVQLCLFYRCRGRLLDDIVDRGVVRRGNGCGAGRLGRERDGR